jgi:hypothetical protein
MYDTKNDAHPHSTEQYAQPIAFLISKHDKLDITNDRKPQHRSLHGHLASQRMENHNTLTKTQAKLNITNDGKTYTTLKTAWLSITNEA